MKAGLSSDSNSMYAEKIGVPYWSYILSPTNKGKEPRQLIFNIRDWPEKKFQEEGTDQEEGK